MTVETRLMGRGGGLLLPVDCVASILVVSEEAQVSR